MIKRFAFVIASAIELVMLGVAFLVDDFFDRGGEEGKGSMVLSGVPKDRDSSAVQNIKGASNNNKIKAAANN
ncbi:hypothetical protein ACHAWC_010999 [Mediolabrus comicus]